MALSAEQLTARSELATTLLKSGSTNKEITDQTREKFGTPIAASQLARIRKDLGMEVKPGRRKKEGEPEVAAKAPAKKEKAAKEPRKTAARTPRKAAAANGNGSNGHAHGGSVNAILKQLMPAMKSEGINMITLEARGRCVKEETIRR